MSPARVGAACAALLGPLDGPVALAGESGALATSLGTRIAGDGEAVAGAVCTFLGERADPPARRARLAALARRLPAGAPLVVVDHNQPRAWWRRPAGWAALAARGLAPARARYPVARETRAQGFTVERLRLAAGERIQLVLARRT